MLRRCAGAAPRSRFIRFSSTAMKLHLPSGLRKALLACLAAVALPAASFPSTLASASGFAAVFLVANQRAYAEFTESDGVSALAEGGNLTIEKEQPSLPLSADETYENFVVKASTSNDRTGLTLSGYTATITGELKEEGGEGFDLRVNGGGTLALRNGGALTGTFAAFDQADIKLGEEGTDNVTLSVSKLGGNGFSFSAAGENEVTLKITVGDVGAGALGQKDRHSTFGAHVAVELSDTITQRFSGVDFSGNSKLKLGTGSVTEFTNVAWGDNVSLFAGELGGNGTLKVDGAGVAHNSYTDTEQDSQKHRLTWSGTTSEDFQSSGTLEIGQNGIFEMTSGFSASKVTLATGSTIQLTSGTLKAETLELGENTATLEMTLTENDNTRLSFSSITQSEEGKLTIKLIGWEDFKEEGYQLFVSDDDQWNTLWGSIKDTWQDIFDFQDEDGDLDGVQLTDGGRLSFEGLADDHVYDGTTGALNWHTNSSSDTGWQGDQKYRDGASVKFTATEGDHAVEVGSDVVAGNLQVTGAAYYNITSSTEGDVHTLTVKSKMEVAEGAELIFSKDVQLKLEGVASLAEGSTLTMSSNIALGQNGKISGSGTIKKMRGFEGDVYVQFEVEGEMLDFTGTVESYVGGKLDGVTLDSDSGVGLQKTGSGMLYFHDGGGTLAYDLDIEEGVVQFSGNNYTLKGKLTGKGSFNVATAASGNAPASRTLIMEKGGSISGELVLSQWGARLSLGDNLEVGGITKLDGANLVVATDGNQNNRFRTVLSQDGVTANLAVNVVGVGVKEVDGLVVEEGVTLVKKGAGTQKFTTSTTTNEVGNGTTQLKGGVQVDEGVLEFEGEGSVISGALSNTDDATGGTLRLTSGDLTLSGGGKHGGTLELTAGTITVSGENALEVGTLKAVAGVLDLRTNFTVNNMSLAADERQYIVRNERSDAG